jgi:predicted outer membrane lipoprotein
MHAEHADSSKLNELPGRVIGCAFTVLNSLWAGFLDLLINDVLLVELKTVKALDDTHMAPGA